MIAEGGRADLAWLRMRFPFMAAAPAAVQVAHAPCPRMRLDMPDAGSGTATGTFQETVRGEVPAVEADIFFFRGSFPHS